MVDRKYINESIEHSVSVNNISNIILDNITVTTVTDDYDLLVKCSDNRATRAGEGAELHLANDPDGVEVPLRHLQDMGYDENGNHIGYLADITYPSGFRIDYVNGVLVDGDGKEYPMGFDDNFRVDGNGNMTHVREGSANGLFKYQWDEMNRGDRSNVIKFASAMKRNSLVEPLRELDRDGYDVQRRSGISEAMATGGRPVGNLALSQRVMDGMIRSNDWGRVDRQDLVVGQQISKSDLSFNDFIKIKPSPSSMVTETSVGFLNDKSLVVRDSVTGDTRSVNGKVNNWDNTYKIYTLITNGDGTRGVYLGYPQNVKASAWDNSGNPLNELDLASNQRFEKVLVDKANGIIIQRPVNG